MSISDPWYRPFLALQKNSFLPLPLNTLPKVTTVQCQYLKLSKWLQYTAKVENHWLINTNRCVYYHRISKISCSLCTDSRFWLQNPDYVGVGDKHFRSSISLVHLEDTCGTLPEQTHTLKKITQSVALRNYHWSCSPTLNYFEDSLYGFFPLSPIVASNH